MTTEILDQSIQKTALNASHRELNAKMIQFAGIPKEKAMSDHSPSSQVKRPSVIINKILAITKNNSYVGC